MTDYRCFLFRTLRNLRKLRPRGPWAGPSDFSSCTTLKLVYCNSFNVLSGWLPSGSAEKLCKVTNFFGTAKIFRSFFQNFFFEGFSIARFLSPSRTPPARLSVAGRSPPGVGPRGLRRSSFPKASAKLRTFSEPPKNSPEKSPDLTPVNQKRPEKPRIRPGTALKPPLPGSRWPRGERDAAVPAPRRIPPPESGLIADPDAPFRDIPLHSANPGRAAL